MPAPPPLAPWIARIWAEFRADNLTRAYRDVLLQLHKFRVAGGQVFPSHATLAERAGCCVRTVQRALDAARTLGLVDWTERRVRAGWRWLRTSNLYRLEHPPGAVQPGNRPRPAMRLPTTGQDGRGGEKLNKKRELVGMLQEAAAMPDLLAARMDAFLARQGQEEARKRLGRGSGSALVAT